MPGRFEGQVAVITGGASGIGAAVARRIRAEGGRVASLDLRTSADADLSVECDAGDGESVARAVGRASAGLGPPTLGVHAAGITRDGMLWKVTPADWDLVLRVNLGGGWHLLRALLPHQRAATPPGGSVVLVGSINGARGKVGQSAYAASKAGLVGLAKTAARETGRFGVRVNVVAPGFIDTPMTAALAPEWRDKAVAETVLGRVGVPDDIAAAAAFLLSGDARHVTGQVLAVDGGQDM